VFSQEDRKVINLLKKIAGYKGLKKYDKPETPYKRIIASIAMSEEVKEKLRRTYEELNPLSLKRQMDKFTQELWKAYDKKMKEREKKTQQEDEKIPSNFSLTQNNFIYNLLKGSADYRRLNLNEATKESLRKSTITEE